MPFASLPLSLYSLGPLKPVVLPQFAAESPHPLSDITRGPRWKAGLSFLPLQHSLRPSFPPPPLRHPCVLCFELSGSSPGPGI